MKREFRITRSIDYKRVRHSGKSYTHPLVVLVKSDGELDHSRAGIIVGKSVGKAVRRNRAKRQLRAIISEFIQNFSTPCDIVIIAREPIKDANFSQIRSTVINLLCKANLIKLDDSDTRRPVC